MTTPQTMLVCGASKDQAAIYRAARKMGLHTIGIDRNPNAYARKDADEFYPICVTQTDEIRSLISKRKIHGIISPASDAAQRTVYLLSNELDLPYKPSFQAYQAATNKAYFQSQVRALGLHTPRFHQSADFGEIREAARAIGYPLIVKPPDASGSRGISRVASEDGLRDAFDRALAVSARKEVNVQEWIGGTHYCADLFKWRGETILRGISLRKLTEPPYFITLEHLFGPDLPGSIRKTIHGGLEAVCARLEISNGPLDVDLVIRDGMVYLLEINTRLPGNGVPELLKLSFGVDPYELTLRLALGEDSPVFRHGAYPFVQHAALKVLASREAGIFEQIVGTDELRRLPSFQDLKVFAREGDRVEAYSQAAHKLGFVILAHPELNRIRMDLATIENNVRVSVKGAKKELATATGQV